MLRDLGTQISNAEHMGQTPCSWFFAEALRREEAARREAEADKIDGLESDLSFAKQRCNEIAAERDALKARAEAAEKRTRDLEREVEGSYEELNSIDPDLNRALERAERAEAENARLRELAEALANAADDVGVQHFDTDTIPGYVGTMQAATLAVRAALAPVEAKHTTGPETYDDALERLAAKSGRSRVPDDYDSDNEG
jgi:hypothetical protein